MTRYLLDTNIISNFAKPVPSGRLIAWMTEQVDTDLFIAAWTVGEIHRGILAKPAGRRRAALETWFAGPLGPRSLFAGRVLPFDERASLVWAELMVTGQKAGKPRSVLDMIIAAVAEANGCRLVTDNERDFAGIDLINPLRGEGEDT